MRLWVLAGRSLTPTTERLVAIAREDGHRVDVLDHQQITVRHAHNGLTLGGAPEGRPDLVLNRMRGDERHLRHATRVQTALESQGVPAVNRAAAVAVAAVKSATAQRLADSGLPQPLTVVGTVDTPATALLEVTGLPAVLKADREVGGLGAHRVDSEQEATETLERMAAGGVRSVLAQPFLTDTRAVIRAVVLSGRVIGAVERRAAEAEWRATTMLGATVSQVELVGPEAALAVAAAESCGLEIAGVDLLRRPGGDRLTSQVLDLEPSPELRLTEEARREDLCHRIVASLAALVRSGRLVG